MSRKIRFDIESLDLFSVRHDSAHCAQTSSILVLRSGHSELFVVDFRLKCEVLIVLVLFLWFKLSYKDLFLNAF